MVPIVELLFDEERDEEESTDDAADAEPGTTPAEDKGEALETLRDRYARGELTDEQFERKLDRLLETESLEDVEDRVREPETE